MRTFRYKMLALLAGFTALLSYLAILSAPSTSFAQETRSEREQTESQQKDYDYTYFKKLPILHDGRIKSLEHFSKIQSAAFELGGMAPIEWLAQSIFMPEEAYKLKQIKIRDQHLLSILKIDERPDSLYSLADLEAALINTQPIVPELIQRPAKMRSKAQSLLLSLHDTVLGYQQLINSHFAYVPLNIQLPDSLSSLVENERPTYMLLQPYSTDIFDALKRIQNIGHTDLSKYSEQDRALILTGFTLESIKNRGKSNVLLRVLPQRFTSLTVPQKSQPAKPIAEDTPWLSPWEYALKPNKAIDKSLYPDKWIQIYSAYRNPDKNDFEAATKEALLYVQANLSTTNKTGLFAEQLYNKISPLQTALLLYVFSFLVLLLINLKYNVVQNLGAIQLIKKVGCAQYLYLFGAAIHGAALVSRSLILHRPPVGTLYESILFVSFITILCGAVLYRKNKEHYVLICALIVSVILFAITPFFKPIGDDLVVLEAVLETNFWLTTHVLCITAGYGLCIISAVIAHYYLYIDRKQRVNYHSKSSLAQVYGSIYRLSLVSLFFTAFGTVLGGIWADQSWGRFWGWDPKENGALLIVLWLIWLTHGKIAGILSKRMYAACVAFLNIIVAIAWFGVNLLNVGLHSYGFSNQTALSLAVFCVVQLAIITVLLTPSKSINKNGLTPKPLHEDEAKS